MPILSDFTIIFDGSNEPFRPNESRDELGGRVTSDGRTIEFPFQTGGRHDSDAYIDLTLSPRDARPGDDFMNLAVQIAQVRSGLQGTRKNLVLTRKPSDDSGQRNGLQRYLVVIQPGELSGRSEQDNMLILRPVWEPAVSPSDSLLIGPIICHFHQKS